MMPARRERSPPINSGGMLRPATAVAAAEAPHITTAAKAAASARVVDRELVFIGGLCDIGFFGLVGLLGRL